MGGGLSFFVCTYQIEFNVKRFINHTITLSVGLSNSFTLLVNKTPRSMALKKG